ncbi:hypothetical protein GQ53DRAFT_742804 [Thozetella sp. PMI_491]|nr:hypothetical protein GQ53DRAFT_742804 [Thozetella sp. PMI_491]
MALNLARRFPLTVWNRTDSDAKYAPLVKAGALIGKTPVHLVEQSDVIFCMLFDGPAIESILDQNVRKALSGKTLINTSSVSVEFSEKLDEIVRASGGSFVEMPVSGSKVPAEQGRLVGMVAGDSADAKRVLPFVEPLTTAAIYCGPIGSGLRTKYAVNLFLIAITAGLAEAMNLARAQGLNLESFGRVLNAGPMASDYSKIKIAKMLQQDWSPQAAIEDCYNSTQLIRSAAKVANTTIPVAELCSSLYCKAKGHGLGGEDMIAIYKLFSKLETSD